MPDSRRRKSLAPVVGGAGPVMLIGGAEDKLRGRQILKRFVRLAGGAEATVAVIATASEIGEEALRLYEGLFLELGVAGVTGLHPRERHEADLPEMASKLSGASAVFLTGGNQLRLTSVVAGTRLHHGLHLARDRGAVIAGTSAGASALASHMMAFGQPGATPRHGNVQTAAGLDLVEGTVVDGSHMETDAYRLRGRRPMMVSGAALHSIPSGYWFDLRARVLIHEEGSAADEREASE